MAVEPEVHRNSHSTQHSGEHRVSLGPLVQLLWPEAKRSGPYIPDEEDSPHRLWKYKGRKPQWPWNLLVYANGTVKQTPNLPLSVMDQAQYVLYGGHDYRMESGSWLHQTLTTAGYQFREVEGVRP